MVPEKLSVSDLVLQVSERLDPKKFDLDAYEGFIDLLCAGRGFQEESLRTVLRFLLSGRYSSTEALAEENYKREPPFEQAYGSLKNLVQALPLPDKLACNVDLATGTGKSYIIYGLARILLNEGAVDRVLVLCPSRTIEAGLLEKFRDLSAQRDLRDSLPKRGGIKNPDVIQATSTIEPGMICVENIHATYFGTKSAIADSLRGRGDTTLVINDEAHHVFSPGRDTQLKKWKQFLEDPEFSFRRIVGFSGTCYVGNEYFPDVVFRYSLAQAMDEGFVKKVWYVDDDVTRTEEEAFQKIHANHEKNRKRFSPLKPLTILVTKDIKAAKDLGDRLVGFLRANGKRSRVAAEDRVLVVTSSPDHVANVAKLPKVDLKNPIEWIVSVSMLTEGWDVKNVLQIVPHEKRAFNSKLLIAQVLGRGLRIPLNRPDAEVTVFNHERWASAIRHLVDEVMEHDLRIAAYPVAERDQFNFEIHQLDYKRKERLETVSPSKGTTRVPDIIRLIAQPKRITRRTRYRRAGSSAEREEQTEVTYKFRPVRQVAATVRNRLKSIDLDLGTTYAKKVQQRKIEDIIRKSLAEIGVHDEMVSEENEQKILQSFGPLARRKSRQRPRLTVEVERVRSVTTRDIPKRSIALGALRKEAGVAYDEISLEAGEDQDRRILAEEIEAGHPFTGSAVRRVPNPFNFKVPTNVILSSHRPERDFVARLLRPENSKVMDAWVKSPDSSFYSIEYTYRKGEHQKQASFNPDFFIKINKGKEILVIEVKADGDFKDENRGKLKYASQHFELLNKKQKKSRYYFYFVSPKDYDAFFEYLRQGKHGRFRSELHSALLA